MPDIGKLSDVDTTTVAPNAGESLVFDGANWVPGFPSTTPTESFITYNSQNYTPTTTFYYYDNTTGVAGPNNVVAGTPTAGGSSGSGVPAWVSGDGSKSVVLMNSTPAQWVEIPADATTLPNTTFTALADAVVWGAVTPAGDTSDLYDHPVPTASSTTLDYTPAQNNNPMLGGRSANP